MRMFIKPEGEAVKFTSKEVADPIKLPIDPHTAYVDLTSGRSFAVTFALGLYEEPSESFVNQTVSETIREYSSENNYSYYAFRSPPQVRIDNSDQDRPKYTIHMRVCFFRSSDSIPVTAFGNTLSLSV